jgi:hypothetical protein
LLRRWTILHTDAGWSCSAKTFPVFEMFRKIGPCVTLPAASHSRSARAALPLIGLSLEPVAV